MRDKELRETVGYVAYEPALPLKKEGRFKP